MALTDAEALKMDRSACGLVDELAERIPNLRSQMLRSLGNIQPGYLLDPAYLKPGDPD